MEKEKDGTVPVSRIALDEKLISVMSKFSIADIQQAVWQRYKKSKVGNLSNEQVEDLIEFLEQAGAKKNDS